MRWCVAVLLLLLAPMVRAAEDPFLPAATAKSVDPATSFLIVAGKKLELPPALAAAILVGARGDEAEKLWERQFQVDGKAAAEGEYLLQIGLAAAVKAETVQVGGGAVALWTGTNAPPADPAAAEGWTACAAPPRQASPAVIPLPPGTAVRAVRVQGRWRGGRRSTGVPVVRLWAARLYNATPFATANAESEYTMYPEMGPPQTFPVSALTRGNGHWQNTGNNRDKVIPRAPISDVSPSWIVLSWPAPVTVSGLALRGNLKESKLYAYRGAPGLNPTLASEKDWRLVPTQPARGGDGLLRCEAQTTTGLKLVISETEDGPIAKVEGMHVLAALGAAPLPELPDPKATLPKYTVAYTLPAPGIATVVVNGPDGARVRNLIARQDRPAGESRETWDLKDENGRVVPPGNYRYVALYHPPLELRYEMTPYPNISNFAPANSPWLTGHSGSGEWLADHSAPNAVCPVGDRVFIGSPCAEGGVALLEADLDGRKLWGHHNFMAWTGPQRLASDGQSVYIHAWTGGVDHLWAVDLKTKQTRTVWEPAPDARRQRNVRGLAAADGKLYLAIRGSVNWLNNAVDPADVDIEQCYPKIPRKNEKERYDADPRVDFLRLFRITGTPPGQRGGFTYLETSRGPEMRQHTVLALRKPVTIGSLVFPVPDGKDGLSYRLSVLKPAAPWPCDPEKEEQWQRLELQGLKDWAVLALPAGTTTRALRITFIKGKDDALTDIIGDDPVAGGGAREAWAGRLEGMKLLRRRFGNLTPKATVRVSSGKVNPDGAWDAKRDTPLAPEAPGIYLLEWPAPEQLRGLAIKEVDAKDTEIDVFTGPAGAAVELSGDANWEKVATYRQARRYYYQPDPNNNTEARYMDGYVDFGREVTTRAVRLRIVSQWTTKAEGREGLYGVRKDRGGQDLDATRCRVYGVAALGYLGGEAPVDPLICERLEVYDTAQKKVVQEVPLPKAGDLALAADGTLYGFSGKEVLRLDLAGGKHQPVITDLLQPVCLTLDRAGQFYVYDGAPDRRQVRVYAPDGKYLRAIGTAGGFVAGPWDPTRLGNVVDLAVDQRDQLWVAEHQYHPKRVVVFGTDGTFKREHFDRTIYGGGGVLDPQDKSLLYYGACEFQLDWQTGRTRLKALTWIDSSQAPEQPVYANGRKYLVTRDCFFGQSVGVVYLYEDGRARLAAAVGLADRFPPLQTTEVRQALGKQTLDALQFAWSDRNGDQRVQMAEVAFSPRTIRQVGGFDRELGTMAGGARFQVKEFLPSGVPVYEFVDLRLPDAPLYKLTNGTYFMMGGGRPPQEAAFAADGKQLWGYRTEGNGVHAFYSASPLRPEQVVAEFSIVGHGVMKGGELGEFLVTSSNSGIWHIWTADGLLAGQIFRDLRDPKARHWGMAEHDRGMVVRDVTAGQEHFWGNVTRTPDDKVYGIWMSTNVFEVVGMDQFQRLGGDLKVGEADITAAVQWDRDRARQDVYRRAKLLYGVKTPAPVKVDGDLADWEGVPESSLGDSGDFNARFLLAYDEQNLYVACEAQGLGPFKNSGNDFHQLFKTGAAVDLQLGTRADADPLRKGPVAGDLRLLLAPWQGKPAAVLYEALVPDAPATEHYEFATGVFRTTFDRVRLLGDARVAARPTERGYAVEASVPLATLGLTVSEGALLKGDWGVLRTDANGHLTMGRHYWSNQSTTIISDIAAEAELQPPLWGHVRLVSKRVSAAEKLAAPGASLEPGHGKDATVDDLLKELKEEMR